MEEEKNFTHLSDPRILKFFSSEVWEFNGGATVSNQNWNRKVFWVQFCLLLANLKKCFKEKNTQILPVKNLKGEILKEPVRCGQTPPVINGHFTPSPSHHFFLGSLAEVCCTFPPGYTVTPWPLTSQSPLTCGPESPWCLSIQHVWVGVLVFMGASGGRGFYSVLEFSCSRMSVDSCG